MCAQIQLFLTYTSLIIRLSITNEFKFKIPQGVGKFSLGC